MVGAIRRILSWSRQQSRISETTSGGNESPPWVVVVANLNPGEAIVIKGRLESENIPVIIQQEAIGSILGLTVGALGSANLLVPEPLAGRVVAILGETFEERD